MTYLCGGGHVMIACEVPTFFDHVCRHADIYNCIIIRAYTLHARQILPYSSVKVANMEILSFQTDVN